MKNNNQIIQQEKEAIHYIDKHVIEKKQQQGDFQIAGFWQETVLNFLKNQALVFCGQSLTHLRKQTILWAVDLSYWLLTNLEDYLINCYQNASREEKELFLQKIKENFPASELVRKLESL